jgi:hypothetical protein
VNAAEQATSLEVTSKIASVVNLFKAEFPDTKSDLNPWADDPDTRDLVDPDSIDIGFHFPGRSRLFQCRSFLIQIRVHTDPDTQATRMIGVELAGFDHQGKQWWISTVGGWEFEGCRVPAEEKAEQIKAFLRQTLELFADAAAEQP